MKSSILAVLGGASTALAAVRGFNYAAQSQTYDTFVSQFKTAASLSGASDFTSARLYTMIQDGTTSTPIDAIQAAIDTNTTLLLGLWASEDQASFNNELAALKSAISTYGSSFADLVVGISVGSEDLYRISPTGIAAGSGAGQSPDTLVNYIGQVRSAISGTSLASAPVGHVDTWNVYVNSSNAEVISNSDFLGLDEYPYYQTTDPNSIGNSSFLFFQAYDKVAAVAGGKPIWVTESGWPVSGPTSNDAVPSVDNAETYWQGVACALENRGVNFWWYILADSGSSPSFGVSSNGKPLYDLACNSTAGYTSTTASSSSATSTASKNSSSATGSGSHSGSASATASSITASGAAGVGSQAATSGASASGTATGSAASGTATGSAASGAATGSAAAGASTGGASIATATGTKTTATGSAGASAATFTGAASKAEGSMAGLAIGALVAALVL